MKYKSLCAELIIHWPWQREVIGEKAKMDKKHFLGPKESGESMIWITNDRDCTFTSTYIQNNMVGILYCCNLQVYLYGIEIHVESVWSAVFFKVTWKVKMLPL